VTGLRSRLTRLESKLGITSDWCPECGGKGKFDVVVLEYGEKPPKGGCPRCGRGHLILISCREPPAPSQLARRTRQSEHRGGRP
jgi:hypothetical protein